MESMQAIDVHDLPEPVAQAIAAMVESLRSTGRAAPHNGSDTTVGQILESVLNSAPIDADAPVHPHGGQEAEIAGGIIEKFRRQGLKL